MGAVRSEGVVANGPARLQSLDALRGFTMFWLMGGKGFALAVSSLLGLEFVRFQLSHSEWEGVRYYDLIWPSFMLMVGVHVHSPAGAGAGNFRPGFGDRRGLAYRVAHSLLAVPSEDLSSSLTASDGD